MTDGITGLILLRVILIGGLVGFALFCLSYSVLVWQRRNTTKLPQWGVIAVFMGVIWLAGQLVFPLFTPREGIVDGNDLFVVKARHDMYPSASSEQQTIGAGDVIARFGSPLLASETALLQSRISEARLKVATVATQSLALDVELLQRREAVRAQLDQTRGFILNLLNAKRDLDVRRMALVTTWMGEKNQLEATAQTSAQSVGATLRQIELARDMLQRSESAVPLFVREEKQKSLIGLRLDAAKAQTILDTTNQRKQALEADFNRTIAAYTAKDAEIDTQLAESQTRFTRLTTQSQEIEQELVGDTHRAQQEHDSQVAVVQQQLETLLRSSDKAVAETEVRAPFAGRVIYRNPAPGLVQEGYPILAMSTDHGFIAKVWLSQSEAAEIAKVGMVRFALNNPLFQRYFAGIFRQIEHAPFENRVIAEFTVELPAEAIELLSHGQPVKVALDWHPGFAAVTALPGVAAIVIGLFGVLMPLTRRQSAMLAGE